MELERIKNVAVIGAGAMGSQIGEQLSRVAKYSVVLCDANAELVNKGLEAIQFRLKKFFVGKAKMSESEFNEVMSRIEGIASISKAVQKADCVIEAVWENLKTKQDVFKQLDENAPAHAVLASNTSGLSITEIAMATKRPDKVVGMHFFNPVHVMRLIEVVRGALTSNETVSLTCDLARKLEKDPVVCKDFSYGFVAGRAYLAMLHETVQMVWERVASPSDIDKALRLGFNYPMGPLELSDFVGGWPLEVEAEEGRVKMIGEKGRTHPLIKTMVSSGYCGGQGKKGIYAFWDEVMSNW
jgi:3-hydroxybutyryl-CoA dehydrogenase